MSLLFWLIIAQWMKTIAQLLLLRLRFLPFLTTQYKCVSLMFFHFLPPGTSSLRPPLTDPFVSMCLCAWVHSTTLPLLPGLIIVLQRALPFSMWYPWQHILPWKAVYSDLSGPPTPLLPTPSPFPYITPPPTPTPHFFPAFSLHFLHWPCYSKHVTLLRSFTFLNTFHIFSASVLLTSCSDLSLHATLGAPTCLKCKAHLLCGQLLWRF